MFFSTCAGLQPRNTPLYLRIPLQPCSSGKAFTMYRRSWKLATPLISLTRTQLYPTRRSRASRSGLVKTEKHVNVEIWNAKIFYNHGRGHLVFVLSSRFVFSQLVAEHLCLIPSFAGNQPLALLIDLRLSFTRLK